MSVRHKGESHRSSGPKQKRLMWQRWRQQDNVEVCAHTCMYLLCVSEGCNERGITAVQEKKHEQMLNMEKLPFQASQNS